MADFVSMVGNMANTKMKMAYDSLWKAFEMQKRKLGDVQSQKILDFVRSDPETREALVQPTFHALNTMVGLGLVTVNQAVDVAFKLKNLELEEKSLLMEYKNKEAYHESLMEQIEESKLRQLTSQEQIKQVQANLYYKKHEQIDNAFKMLFNGMDRMVAYSSNNQLAGGMGNKVLQAYPKLVKFLTYANQLAHERFDKVDVMLNANGQQRTVPHSPYGIVVDTLENISPDEAERMGLTQRDILVLRDSFGMMGKMGMFAIAAQQNPENAQQQFQETQVRGANFFNQAAVALNQTYRGMPSQRLAQFEDLLKQVQDMTSEAFPTEED